MLLSDFDIWKYAFFPEFNQGIVPFQYSLFDISGVPPNKTSQTLKLPIRRESRLQLLG